MGPDTKTYPRPRPAPSAVARFEVRRAGRMRYLETATPAPAPEGGPPAMAANPEEPYPTRREAARRLVPPPAARAARPQPPRSADMLNVLVVDSQKSSSFLVKSILLGKWFSVSIVRPSRTLRDHCSRGFFRSRIHSDTRPCNCRCPPRRVRALGCGWETRW